MIIITEKTKNMITKEKTKTRREENMTPDEWVELVKTWFDDEAHYGMYVAYNLKNPCGVGFEVTNGDTRYRLEVEFK